MACAGRTSGPPEGPRIGRLVHRLQVQENFEYFEPPPAPEVMEEDPRLVVCEARRKGLERAVAWVFLGHC
jgi:hypothetical protein